VRDTERIALTTQVWEFQHPNFQAGGKADLESIKVSQSRTRESRGDRSSLTLRSAKPSCQRRVQRRARRKRLLRDREVQAA
jgi:osomolarity two-component system response regulator SKN7